MALVAAIILTSCSEKRNDVTDSVSFDAYNIGAAYTMPGTAKIFSSGQDITFSDSVSLMLPSQLYDINITALRDTILSYAIDMKSVENIPTAIKSSLDSTAASLGYEYKRLSHCPASPDGFSYTTGMLVYLNTDMMVYCIKNDTYVPSAAHGMQSKRYINYYMPTKKTGNILYLTDLFTPEGLKQLPDKIAERAQDMADITGPTSVEGLPTDGNFFISPEGQIVFAYQPYEIASYSQGFINIAFDPTELIEQLSPEGIELFHLSDLQE